MTPSARIEAAIELLRSIEGPARPADQAASEYFRAHRYIGSKDRRAVSDLFYGIVRRRAALDWWLARSGASDLEPQRARAIAALVLVEGWTADDFTAGFDGVRYHPKALSPAERALVRALQKHTLDHPGQPDWVRLEVPEWLIERLRPLFGERLERELAALQEEAPFDLRVNRLKATREEALSALEAEGIAAEPSPISPIGLRLAVRIAIANSKAFREGLVEVQDEGSQIVALLTDARAGMRVCDFCAGAGGKTLTLAAQMKNQGQITALDVRESRLARAAQRLRRAGVHNVTRRVLASQRDPWVKHHKESFDRVFIDAPCTGCGTWRRNPDAKWRIEPSDIAELAALQADILDSSARLVRRGGRLVYATCSLLPEENEAQVVRFLASHDSFRHLPVEEIWPAAIGGRCPSFGPNLQLTPASHGTDGFFAAIFERG
ncbi:MAG TPA: RsmB/NOP family class I SAM-dependent RNA methyltransferase [Alphaproteobacteria bacterium]|nr:RsmB/NOP family class I SAM-dependent RNA methyltransferase [Alphaproteobacteria bacterium]